MGVYLVACDLRLPDRNYGNFYSALEQFDGKQLLERVYLVETPADADTLREHLAGLSGPDDRIWVSRITEDHSGYVMAPAAEWLEQHRPL